MGMDAGGPSAMSLYSNAGSQGQPPDTGKNMAAGLVGDEMAYSQRYAPPTTPAAEAKIEGFAGDTGIAYNTRAAQPVKYSVPSYQKERMKAREEVRDAIGELAERKNVLRTDPISDEEVSYLMTMKEQAELADFDRYVNSLIDPRKPGNLKWLMEVYPQYVNRRIQQVHTDYEFALRNQMIDNWGINTFDDLHFKYLVDQGKLEGPKLQRDKKYGDKYAPGLLSPFAFKFGNQFHKDGLKLPYATADQRTREQADKLSFKHDNAPLGMNREAKELATSMYKTDKNREP